MDSTFQTKDDAKKAFKQAVWLYNYKRPQMGLGYRIPAEVHAQMVSGAVIGTFVRTLANTENETDQID